MTAIHFAPAIAWPWLAALAGFCALVTIPALIARSRGALLRLLGFTILIAALAAPQWQRDTTTKLPDIALVLVDHSQSMQIGNRETLAARALAALRASAGTTRLITADIPPQESGGTAITPTLNAALTGIQPDQLAATIVITDGQIADTGSLPANANVTVLLTAPAAQTDRELRLINAPAYGIVGQPQTLSLMILDHGANDAGSTARLRITEDGTPIATQPAIIGQTTTISLPVPHAGPCLITASVDRLPGEVSQLNNQASFTLIGIRRRLNILLVSGAPDMGERAWRRLLKSDPAVRLIHFTILRTPGESLDAAPQDVALVPFPTQQLFQTDIDKFDLIILDGFSSTGLLPAAYLANIAAYVTKGGALLAEFGPEFSGPDSLANTALSTILPATPDARGTIIGPFTPTITALGSRHPITAPFANTPLPPWDQMQAADQNTGNTLMTGPDGLPLLITATAGKGRVAMLLSDQFWLWTKGGAHAGPALPLLRRLVHWLLREPALAAESLHVDISGGTMHIARQTLSATNPGTAVITAPDGTTTTATL
ncbi:MAG: hypothetical protein POH28_10890, partial [Acidocella sp.]|nr:hypothetical protein [Acidocella sp.]